MSTSAAERLDVLDGLRGLAILLVVWYHAWLVTGQTIPGVNFIAEAGFLGVDLFFFLSGFCLFYPFARALLARKPPPTTGRFFYRRAAKIVPSYLLALIIFAFVYRAQFASAGDAFVQLASHLTFLHTLNPATFGGISGPFWTIAVEVQFYLLFPFIVRFFQRAPLATYAALVVGAQAYRMGVDAAGLSTTFWWINQLPAYLDVFAAGMLGAHVLVGLRLRPAAVHAPLVTGISIAAFAAALGGLFAISSLGRGADVNAVYAWVNAHRLLAGPLCLVAGLSTAVATTGWRCIIASRVLVFFSVISYNLYLWNLEIVVWYRAAGWPAPVTFAAAIATAVAIATAITYFLERPLLDADFLQLAARLRVALRRVGAPAAVEERA
ncbi:MAG: acyltransferase family protein [Candidatus Velthaea sp.]